MKAMIVLLSLLVLLPVGGEAKRDKRQTIKVRDYTSAAWDGVIAQTVNDFNAVMPKGGRLRYEDMGDAPCPPPRRRQAIAICSRPVVTDGSGTAEVSGIVADWHRIWLSDRYTGAEYDQFRTTTVCHEMMHVLTGIPDNEGALPDGSCCWGDLPQPGPFDVAQLRKAFKKHR